VTKQGAQRESVYLPKVLRLRSRCGFG